MAIKKHCDRVLITDCWSRKSLSVVRALGKENIEVHSVSHKSLSPALYSKYTKRFFILPDPEKDEEDYKKRILELVKKNRYACLMALEDETIRILQTIRKEIEKYTKFPFASKNNFERVYDKWEVFKIAKKLKIPVPKSYCPRTKKELEQALKDLKFPILIKPRKSCGSRGIKEVNNRKELYEHYPIISARYKYPLLQERIDRKGEGLGVGVIVDKSKILASFSYKRLREYPVKGGPSTLRESTNNRLIKSYAEKILKKLALYGVAMVEFKLDLKDNQPKLLEINPRFWGSLELAVRAGINFPHLLYLLSQNKKIKRQKYKVGVRCRWLIPGDMLHFLSNPNRFKMKPSFFKFFDKSTYYDELSMRDIKASLMVVFSAILNIFDIDIWRKGILRR